MGKWELIHIADEDVWNKAVLNNGLSVLSKAEDVHTLKLAMPLLGIHSGDLAPVYNGMCTMMPNWDIILMTQNSAQQKCLSVGVLYNKLWCFSVIS